MKKSTKYRNYRRFTVTLAKKSGDFLYRNFGKVKKIEEKSFRNYVTDIDKKSERIIIEAIRKKFPDHDILAEERGRINKKSDYLWVIDPLDGTHNYIAQIPIYGVSIALCFREKPIVGVICIPPFKELYETEINEGSYLNGKKIEVSENKLLRNSFIIPESGFQWKTAKKIKDIECFIRKTKKIRILGCLSFQLACVATGRIEGIAARSGKPWDYAAGILLVQEAGGKITTFKGKEFTIPDEDLIATNGKIHNQLIKLLKRNK